MAAPPCDQHHESADDSENGSFRHFLTHLVCILERLIDRDLRHSGLVTRMYRGRARGGSQRQLHHANTTINATANPGTFCFDIILFRPRMSEVIVFMALLPAGSSPRHYASAGFAGATKERIAYPSSELNARGKRASRSGFVASSVPRRRQIPDRSRKLCLLRSSRSG